MRKLQDGFTRRGNYGWKYPWPQMTAQLGTVFELTKGEDFTGSPESVRRAAYQWAIRHTGPGGGKLRAVTSINEDTIEIMFEEDK